MLDRPHKMIIRTPGKEPQAMVLGDEPVRVGRASKSEICLDDLLVSRQHAVFHWENDRFFLSDLNSANGTLLNSIRLSGSARVRAGDRVQIGNTVIELEGFPEVRSPADKAGDAMALRPETTLSLPLQSKTDAALHSLIASVRDTGLVKKKAKDANPASERLAMINDVGRALLAPRTLDEVLREIVFLVLEVVPAERAFLFLKQENGELVCKVACHRHEDGTRDAEPIRISRTVADEVVGNGRPLLTCDTRSDERFQQRQSIVGPGILSIMAVPLAIGGRSAGMIYVDSRTGSDCFSNEDLGLLATVASVVDIKVENALLLEQRLENERMKQQLENARQIQVRLLPAEPPRLKGYDLAGSSIPCFAVGGDYYDFIQLGQGKIALVLADVAGKAMDAALLVSCLHACLRSQAKQQAPAAEKIAVVNRYLFENTPETKFATLFYAELDSLSHTLESVNAGHNLPLLVRADGRVERLTSNGMPVGLMETATYETTRFGLKPGDLLLVYSDGLSDAENRAGEQFGLERLEKVVSENNQVPALQLLERIDQMLNAFQRGNRPTDDVTLLALKRLA